MPTHSSARHEHLAAVIELMIARDVMQLEHPLSLDDYLEQFGADTSVILAILQTRYLVDRVPIPRSGNLNLIYQYAESPALFKHFIQMVRVTPACFSSILGRIETSQVFLNKSNNSQIPIETQLAIALYRFARHGNGASVVDIARMAGIGAGTVDLCTRRVIKAILELHRDVIRPLTSEERLTERRWVRSRNAFPGFEPGIFQYDGSEITLWQKPGLNGDAYYSRHGLYELNAQIGCVGSNLRIIDYSVGLTGSAHDAIAFEKTAASQFSELIFQDDEFAWADSAYTASYRVISIHKAPANLDPKAQIFDTAVSRIRIRSEHCNAALKGRWQSLKGLRISINRKRDHLHAMNWISACFVLHNIALEVEGSDWVEFYAQGKAGGQDSGVAQLESINEPEEVTGTSLDGGSRRSQLVDDYFAYYQERHRD
ncbi:hypothetical protein FRC12_024712 [Ceratobasidium sp. 428]|nr:hypothetical protein FRC12_024712 [Ceratobasidium sp. 428]